MKPKKNLEYDLTKYSGISRENCLTFYTVDSRYYHRLREADMNNVLFLKTRRPFIGIVLTEKSRTYFAPCTSPKERYSTENYNRTFLLINNGIYGAIRYDSMVPIPLRYVKEFNYKKISLCDETKKFDNLQRLQLGWIRKNSQVIIQNAKIYMDCYRNNSLTEEERKYAVNLKKVNKIYDEFENIHQKNPQNDYRNFIDNHERETDF